MKSIVTRISCINLANESEPHDFSELFSEEVADGWDIVSVSTNLCGEPGQRIIVITALLEK